MSEQTTATTPFMVRAIDEGIDFVGGKKDGQSHFNWVQPRSRLIAALLSIDISVLVGVIGDRDPGERVGGLALHTV